jgi:hypothetical protein
VRWSLFWSGIAWSALALAVVLDPLLVYGARVNNVGDVAVNAFEWFLVTNPPTFVLLLVFPKDALLSGDSTALFCAVGLSGLWWFALAAVFRRRRARILRAI